MVLGPGQGVWSPVGAEMQSWDMGRVAGWEPRESGQGQSGLAVFSGHDNTCIIHGDEIHLNFIYLFIYAYHMGEQFHFSLFEKKHF